MVFLVFRYAVPKLADIKTEEFFVQAGVEPLEGLQQRREKRYMKRRCE